MIFDEECLLIMAQNVYFGVSGTTGRVLLFPLVSSQGYPGCFQDGEGELLPDIVHSVRSSCKFFISRRLDQTGLNAYILAHVT